MSGWLGVIPPRKSPSAPASHRSEVPGPGVPGHDRIQHGWFIPIQFPPPPVQPANPPIPTTHAPHTQDRCTLDTLWASGRRRWNAHPPRRSSGTPHYRSMPGSCIEYRRRISLIPPGINSHQFNRPGNSFQSFLFLPGLDSFFLRIEICRDTGLLPG